MRLRSDYELLGVIKGKASNGLSIYEKVDEKTGAIKSGQCNGGNIGDMVLKKIGGFSVLTINRMAYEAMPKDMAEVEKLGLKQNASIDEINADLIAAKREIATLKESKSKSAKTSANLIQGE